ncbi:MAG: tripartite tricarboxylate transporter TctB family protein [Desulfobacterales bacterium]|nr:tripartite tricarboxylate transporter TctB family protein [Desulfobacterales bacterium]
MKPADTHYVRILLEVSTVLSAFHIFKNYRKREKEEKKNNSKALPFLTAKQLTLILMIIGYVLMYYVVGFFIASILFIFLNALVLGYRKIPQLTIITLSITGVVYYVFFSFLKISRISGFLFR